MIWILCYYNSLPDMPKGCSLFSNDVMHRDFFMCNPANTGHFLYPRFETLSYDTGCHRNQVVSLLKQSDLDRFVIFYTRHTQLTGTSKNKVVGYFRVGKQFEPPPIGFKASESILLPKGECITIDYKAKGVPVSWGHSPVKQKINGVFHEIKAKYMANISIKYKEETKNTMARLRTSHGKKWMIRICERCKLKFACYWGKKSNDIKERKLMELY